ncbi:MAG: hypothetical protein V1729_06495 [Candidatus Woesearchaeota archaeon]
MAIDDDIHKDAERLGISLNARLSGVGYSADVCVVKDGYAPFVDVTVRTPDGTVPGDTTRYLVTEIAEELCPDHNLSIRYSK